MAAFDTVIAEQDGVLSGPLRAPKQMLAAQEYDGHTSIHDDATAQKLGFKGATIEDRRISVSSRRWGLPCGANGG